MSKLEMVLVSLYVIPVVILLTVAISCLLSRIVAEASGIETYTDFWFFVLISIMPAINLGVVVFAMIGFLAAYGDKNMHE